MENIDKLKNNAIRDAMPVQEKKSGMFSKMVPKENPLKKVTKKFKRPNFNRPKFSDFKGKRLSVRKFKERLKRRRSKKNGIWTR